MPSVYLVTKAFEPAPGSGYKASLASLEHEDSFAATTENTAPVQAVVLEDHEVEEVRARAHVIAVEEDVEDYALSLDFDEDALSYHQLTACRAAGHNGEGVNVAVLDTGVKDATVGEQFRGRLLATRSFISGEEVEDGNGHGDFCCVAACPPGASLIVGKVLSNAGSGARSGIVQAIDWAVGQGANVISMSLGGPGSSEAYDAVLRAAREKGVVVFVAAGNEGREGKPVSCPGNSPYACAVAAMNPDSNKIADFSCKGPEVDFAGAGVNITYAGKSWSGTSMATPLVADTYATVLGATKDPVVALKALVSTALDNPNEPPTSEGVGVTQAMKAISAITPAPPEKKPIRDRLRRLYYMSLSKIREEISAGRDCLLEDSKNKVIGKLSPYDSSEEEK